MTTQQRNGTNPKPEEKLTEKKTLAVELGTGLSIWAGVVSEEYLPELRPWSKAHKVITEMQDDVVLGTLLESVSVPLLDSPFLVEAASDSDADKEAAEWLQKNTIDSESFSWLDHVEESLSFMSMGWFLAEIVLELQKEDGRFWLKDLMPIGHDTLLRWDNPDDLGYVKTFVQQIRTNSTMPETRSASLDKMLHFTFRGPKRNPMGRSLFRNLYRPWYFAKNLQVVEAIGAERDVGNVPVFEMGEGYYTDDDIAKIKTALSGLRMDETAYLIVPNGAKASPFGAGGKVYDIRTIIRDYQHLMRQRFFMDFVSLGSEQVGTQALAKEETSFFSLALGSVQRRMVEVWSKQLINYLFFWNRASFPEITGPPKLIWRKPGKLNVQSVAQSVSTLVSSNVFTPTSSLEDNLREAMELPPITEQEREEYRNQQLERAKEEQAMFNPQETQGAEKPKGEISGGDTKTTVA